MKTLPHLSLEGAAFIGAFEGFRGAPYNDAAQPPNATIGFGHLLHRGPVTAVDTRRWGTITRGQAARMLEQDAHAALLAIERFIAIALDQQEVDGLCSFVYNCGADSLAGHVGKAINAKPPRWKRTPKRMRAWRSGVSSALLAWTHAGGVELEGLVRRRHAELVVIFGGHYTRAEGNPYANS